MRILFIILLTTTISATADQLKSKPVVLASPSYWCPYACDTNGEELGFSVDIVLAALQSQGIPANYQNMPYLRAQKQLKEGKIDGIIAAYKDEVSNAIFPQKPVSYSLYCFYSYQHMDFFWNESVSALQPYKLLVTAGYSYSPEVDAYIAGYPSQLESLKGNNITDRAFKMLHHKRADLFLEDARLYQYKLKKENMKPAINRGCLKATTLGFLALTRANLARSQIIADAYDRGFSSLEDSGELQVILEKYNIKNFYSPSTIRDR